MTDAALGVFLAQVTGHRLWYVRLVCDEVVASGTCAQVWIPAAVRGDDAVRTHLEPVLGRRVSITPYDDSASAALRRASTEHGELLLTDGDRHVAQVVAILLTGRVRRLLGREAEFPRVRLLLLRLNPGTSARGRLVYAAKTALLLVARLLRLPLDACALVISSDATPTTSLARPVADPVVFDPSPAVDRESARRMLGLPPSSPLAAIVGAITSRKCYVEAVQAIERCTDVTLVVAGRLDDDARAYFATLNTSRVVVRDSYLDDTVLDQYILASDAVLTLYTNHGSSGVTLKAVAAGTPIVAYGNAEVIAHVERTGAGIVVSALDAPVVADGIHQALALGRTQAASTRTDTQFARALLVQP